MTAEADRDARRAQALATWREELPALLPNLSPGPWEVELRGDEVDSIYVVREGEELFEAERVVITDTGVYPPKLADAQFIAHARTAVPELLRMVERLDRECVAARAEATRQLNISQDLRNALVTANERIERLECFARHVPSVLDRENS